MKQGRKPAPRGYTEMAHLLNREAGFDPPIDRRQVHVWATRATRNAAGRAFPLGPPFDPELVVRWARQGIPDRWGDGYVSVARRNERHSQPQAYDLARERNERGMKRRAEVLTNT